METKEDDNTLFVHYGDNVVCLKKSILEDVDTDEVTRIDYSNLYGEIVTAPALMSRLGNLKAEVEAEVRMEKLDLNVFEAQKRAFYDKRFLADSIKATVQKLEDSITLDDEVIAKRKKLITLEKALSYVSSLFFAAKDKSDKLNNLLLPTTPEEFITKLVEGKINTFLIKKSKHVM
jgi:hypothetical protein